MAKVSQRTLGKSTASATQVLRIGLDARPLQLGFKAHSGRGTGRYTDELARALLKIQDTQELPVRVELTRPPEPSAFDLAIQKFLPLGKRTFESQFVYPRQVSRMNVDLMHFFSHGDAPSRPLLPQVITVLDLIPLRFPELYRAKKSNARFRFARYLELQAVRKACGVFAISEATKRDVVDILGLEPDRIVVTPLAVTEQFNDAAVQAVPELLTLTRSRLGVIEQAPYLLYVGGIDPRKNVSFLIEVLAELHRSREDAPMLVLAGSIQEDDQYPLLQQRIVELGMQEQVLELGRVSENELIGLYQHAMIFLFPSLYEGFGLPVLEAMACGCPVLAANNSSIPEVAGDAAVLLNDGEHRQWVATLSALLDDVERRHAMRAAGVVQAKRFSWEATAQKTLEGYLQFLSLECALPWSEGGARYEQQR